MQPVVVIDRYTGALLPAVFFKHKVLGDVPLHQSADVVQPAITFPYGSTVVDAQIGRPPVVAHARFIQLLQGAVP